MRTRLLAKLPLSRLGNGSVLQRKCACGQHATGGECEGCKKKEGTLQRAGLGSESNGEVPPIVHEVLRSPGQPLDADTRDFMESRFGHDFSGVRVHNDARSAESARRMNALAYTVDRDIVFASGQFAPGTERGSRLLAHELTHVVQQQRRQTPIANGPEQPAVSGGAWRIPIAPVLEPDSAPLEREAEAIAGWVASPPERQATAAPGIHANTGPASIQCFRQELPTPIPLCGRSLTHLDIEPPRTRPLVPCPVPPVTRINIVGREVSSRSTGRGRIIFNLHVGYFRDPATGRLCGIVDDSLTCVAGRCQILGCFPTLREVVESILNFLWDALKVIGLILLAIVIAIILGGLLEGGVPEGEPGFSGGGPILAGGEKDSAAGSESGATT